MKERPAYMLKEFDKPLYTAAHFGFMPIEAPRITQVDLALTEDCNRAVTRADEKAAFIRTYIERDLAALPHPLAVSWKSSKGKQDYSLELVGFPIGVSEAKLIRTALSILGDEGHEGLSVEINSIGDKDSTSAYERELLHHIRKIALSAEARKIIKEDIWNLLLTDHPEIQAIRHDLPSSIASLSADSRSHFKEVLEYLEALGIEFRLEPRLVGNKNLSSETLFAIRDGAKNTVLAEGYRYSRLSKRFGLKKELPLIGVTLFGGETRTSAIKVYKDLPHPKFYLVHLGREARMKALPLIETLRQNRIPLYHYLGKDKLTAQLETADKLRTPYLIIVGQKEALDGTVTIRNVATRAQDTVPAGPSLADYLRAIPF